jgi:hypothetical protein
MTFYFRDSHNSEYCFEFGIDSVWIRVVGLPDFTANFTLSIESGKIINTFPPKTFFFSEEAENYLQRVYNIKAFL